MGLLGKWDEAVKWLLNTGKETDARNVTDEEDRIVDLGISMFGIRC